MILQKIPSRQLMRLMRFWPPYLASGVRVDEVDDSFTKIRVSMKQHFWNTNYVGVHFGGSLYSMSDPFYMFILLEHIGRDFIVWDKEASIKFIKPGKGKVSITFKISTEEIERIKDAALKNENVQPEFETLIHDQSGEVVAKVWKKLYVKQK